MKNLILRPGGGSEYKNQLLGGVFWMGFETFLKSHSWNSCCFFPSAGLQPHPVLIPSDFVGTHHHVQAGHGTQSHGPAGGKVGIPAFPGWEWLLKNGNVVQEWFLKRGNCGFGLRWGIPAGLFMDTARLGGTQDLENVGLSSRIFI